MPTKKQTLRTKLAQKKREYLAKRPHRSFRKTPKQLHTPPMATIKQVAVDTWRIIWREKYLFGGLALLYMLATYIFVGGIAQADFVDLKSATLSVFGGRVDSIGTVLSLISSTMGGAFTTSMTELQQFLQIFIGMLFWLSLVWMLRMRFAEQTIKIRDALYNSAAPLVPYVLIGLIIMAQITPGAIGIYVFSTAIGGGFLQGGVEVMLFAVAALLLCALSIYWLAGSLLALVVVTLPNMYPWQALSIASELAVGRRLRLVGHTLALAATLFLAWILVLLPTILLDAWLRFDWLPLVPFMVQLMGALTLIYFSTYVYRLYRSLI